MIHGKIHHCAGYLPHPTKEMREEEQVHACPRCLRTWRVYRYRESGGLFFQGRWGYAWEPYAGPVDPIGNGVRRTEEPS